MSSTEKPKSSNKIYAAIAIIVVLVVAIGAGVYLYNPQQVQ